MDNRAIKRIAIVGGGTAGWMAASVLARALPGTGCTITVVESPDIPIVGVGEATIPPIIDLLRFLGINEADFVRHTAATFKLGIKFTDWRTHGHSYWHPFGTFGMPVNLRPFYHAWHRARAEGLAPRFHDFSLAAALGAAGTVRLPEDGAADPLRGLRYALHFDAVLVGRYFRAYAGKLGCARLERTVADVTRRADGSLDELVFSEGGGLQADFYLDCSGFRGVLIEETLKTGYVDWSSLLPCDRAVAVPTEMDGVLAPFTAAGAREAGWRWCIPLQHRVGNGYVYSSAHIGETRAADDLMAHVAGRPLADPRLLRFTTGRRRLFWSRNCVALGLAGGFLEPLESTSIHLVMSGLYKLLEHFPDLDFDQSNIDSYNAELIGEMEAIRDFLVLHYCLTQRDDTDFWRYCSSMPLPDTLARRIALYRATGRIRPGNGELFTDLSWFYIFEGMGVVPTRHDPLIDVVPLPRLREILSSLAEATADVVAGAPAHASLFAPPQRQ